MAKTMPQDQASVTQNSAAYDKKRAYSVFTILLVINILNYTDRYILTAILPFIQEDFKLTETEIGLLSSSFLLVYALASLPLGVWADKVKRKNVVAVCVAIWSVATVFAGFTKNFVQLFLARSVLGIGEAGYAPASLSMLGDSFPKNIRGRILSFWSTGNLIGTALGMGLGGIIASNFGWQWAFYIVGLPGMLAALFIWLSIEPKRGAFESEGGTQEVEVHGGHGNISKGFWKDASKIFSIPTYWVLLGAFIASFFIVGAAGSELPLFLIQQFQVPKQSASLIAGGGLVVGSLIGIVLGGWLADKLQKRWPFGRLLVSALSFLIGAPFVLVAFFMNDVIFFMAVIVPGIVALSMCLGPLQAVVQDIIAPQVRSTALGLAMLIAHLLGDAASPTILGIIAENTHSWKFAFLTTGPIALLIAGFICLIGLRTVGRDMERMQEQMEAGKQEQINV